MSTFVLSGSLYREMVRSGAANLNKNRDYVNDLNVFPVPDGDTGDNMFMTIDSGTQAAKNSEELALGKMSEIIARGMLLGARGNSGVILSRIFSGIAKGLTGNDSADVRVIGQAFEDSIKEAYGAVSKPVEGTILSVYRDAVTKANSGIAEESTLESYFEDFIEELHESLARTPELLDVLKEAGVVDSGAAGLVYIVEGMKCALDGDSVFSEEKGPVAQADVIDPEAFTADSELTWGYCTEFLLRLQNRKCDPETFSVEELTAYLNSIGNSVVSFKEGSIVKVHVHTMNPGEVLNHCQKYGEFLKLKIENMNLQHNESEGAAGAAPVKKEVRMHKKYGTVTVANGEGLIEQFKELCADAVIEGGQSMNPSAEAFLKAFEDLNVDEIFVLPNNSNIILTARQAAELYKDHPVHIIETRDIGQGYAVLSMMDTTLPTAEEVMEEAKESISGVLTGMVSKANKNSQMNGVEVRCGDYIGFADDTIYCDTEDRKDAAMRLAVELGAGDRDIILLFFGKEVPEEEAEELKNELEARFRNAEIYLASGGQPIYDYIMVLE